MANKAETELIATKRRWRRMRRRRRGSVNINVSYIYS
jgi:hypothetical protein